MPAIPEKDGLHGGMKLESKKLIVRGRALVEQIPVNEITENEDNKFILVECHKPQREATKRWVFVNKYAVPFELIYYILRWIGECEDEKYPETFQKGRYMVADFCRDAIVTNASYDLLASKYRLPKSNNQTFNPDQHRLSL